MAPVRVGDRRGPPHTQIGLGTRPPSKFCLKIKTRRAIHSANALRSPAASAPPPRFQRYPLSFGLWMIQVRLPPEMLPRLPPAKLRRPWPL